MHKQQPDPLEAEVEVVSGGGEDRVDGFTSELVDGFTLELSELIAVRSVARFDVTDNRFANGPPLYLEPDGQCKTVSWKSSMAGYATSV